MKNIGLIIGNGFTRDFSDSLELNSSKPLHCFGSSKINYDNFIDYLPAIKKELISNSPAENDFIAIEEYLLKFKNHNDEHCQLRRFLAISYSLFQLETRNHNKINWKWYRWLRKYRNKLSFVISFNYDLILEDTLRLAGSRYFRVGSTEVPLGVPIIKPHGSIDFDIEPILDFGSERSFWSSVVDLNDINGHVRVIPQNEWLKPRYQADIIPPSQNNYLLQHELRWVKAGFETYNKIVKQPFNTIESLVIVGHSYSLPDRKEINFFLDQLKKKTKIYIVGLDKRSPLIEAITNRNLEYYLINHEELPF
jgi:hypothetical protein